MSIRSPHRRTPPRDDLCLRPLACTASPFYHPKLSDLSQEASMPIYCRCSIVGLEKELARAITFIEELPDWEIDDNARYFYEIRRGCLLDKMFGNTVRAWFGGASGKPFPVLRDQMREYERLQSESKLPDSDDCPAYSHSGG